MRRSGPGSLLRCPWGLGCPQVSGCGASTLAPAMGHRPVQTKSLERGLLCHPGTPWLHGDAAQRDVLTTVVHRVSDQCCVPVPQFKACLNK